MKLELRCDHSSVLLEKNAVVYCLESQTENVRKSLTRSGLSHMGPEMYLMVEFSPSVLTTQLKLGLLLLW